MRPEIEPLPVNEKLRRAIFVRICFSKLFRLRAKRLKAAITKSATQLATRPGVGTPALPVSSGIFLFAEMLQADSRLDRILEADFVDVTLELENNLLAILNY